MSISVVCIRPALGSLNFIREIVRNGETPFPEIDSEFEFPSRYFQNHFEIVAIEIGNHLSR